MLQDVHFTGHGCAILPQASARRQGQVSEDDTELAQGATNYRSTYQYAESNGKQPNRASPIVRVK